LFFAFAHVVTVTGATAGDAFGLAVVAFVGRIPVALALGWLFLRRGTIWASFGLHAAFNGILLVLAEIALTST
jgi:membrane protease YdiL (CAAX protease family)